MVTGRADRGAAVVAGLTRATTRPVIAGVAVAVPAFILFWRTLMPDVGFWDTGEFQAIGPVLGIAHPTGYPAYTMLAWVSSVLLQPFGNEATRANLLSAILVAGAVGLVAATVTRLTGRVVVGIATGVALALTGEAWAIGLRADPHALHLFLAALLLLLLVQWEDRVRNGTPADRWLLAAAITFGVALGNHALTFLLVPGIGVFVVAVDPGLLRRWRFVAKCAAALAVTTVAIYLYLPIRSAMNPPMDYGDPQTWEGFKYLVFAEQFRGTFRALPNFGDAVRTVVDETVGELGLFAPLAALGALVSAWRRPALVLMLGTWFLLNWFFALGYINADIGRYYLVPLLAAAVLGGLGAGAILDWLSGLWLRIAERRSISGGERGGERRLSPEFERAARIAGTLVIAAALIGASLTVLPDRFKLLDASRDRIARTWLDTVTDRLPQDAVVVSWWSYSTTLWYGLYVEHRRPDLTVIDDSTIVAQDLIDVDHVIDSYLGQRPVFLIRLPYDLPDFQERYALSPLAGVIGGAVYRVDGMRAYL